MQLLITDHSGLVRRAAKGDPIHTGLTATKMFTNLKVNLKQLGLYIGAKMLLVSYEFEYVLLSVHHDLGV